LFELGAFFLRRLQRLSPLILSFLEMAIGQADYASERVKNSVDWWILGEQQVRGGIQAFLHIPGSGAGD
jgi:hypothetical protein